MGLQTRWARCGEAAAMDSSDHRAHCGLRLMRVNSCHEEGICAWNRAEIEAGDPVGSALLKAVGSAASIPVRFQAHMPS
eukprot:gene16274-biopygen4566